MNQQKRLQKLQELLEKIRNADLNQPEVRAKHLAAAKRAIQKLLKANADSRQEVRQLIGSIHLSQAMLQQLMEGSGNEPNPTQEP
jgi:hypothetical protein